MRSPFPVRLVRPRRRSSSPPAPPALGVLAGVALLAGLAGCASEADAPREEAAATATPLTTNGGDVGAPTQVRDGKPSIAVARDEGETDVRLYEPPKLAVPKLDLGSPFRWPDRGGDDDADELSYGGCRVNCCVMTLQRIFDPARGSPVFIPVVVCQ